MSGPEHLVSAARLLLRHAEQRYGERPSEEDSHMDSGRRAPRLACKDALRALEPIREPEQAARDAEADALGGLFSAFPELLGGE